MTTRRQRAREWAANRLGLATKRDLAVIRRAAYRQGFTEGQDYAGDSGEDEPVSGTTKTYGYRRSTAQGLRDFTQIDRETILEIMWVLWQSNPVADRSMEFKRDYILGRGLQFNADDDDLQEIIDAFVEDNELHARLKEFVLQLYLFGSQCYPVFVRQTDGRVQIGYFDPAEIEDVIPHPDNALKMWAVVIKANSNVQPWQKDHGKRVYRIIRREDGTGKTGLAVSSQDWLAEVTAPFEDKQVGEAVQHDGDDARMGRYVTADQAYLEEWEQELLAAYGLEEYSGSCIYVKVNSVSNQPHGWSDLLQAADWLDQTDETLFSIGEREQLAGYFSWDVTIEGADELQIKERAAELYKRPPKKGSVNVHGNSEQWAYNQAQIGQTESIETVRAMLLHVFGGLGYPEHWYGRGDETNRATAEAQNDPTWRTLEHDQDHVRDLILLMLNFVRDQAVIAGTWNLRTPGVQGEERSEDITVVMPEMTSRDLTTVTSAVATLAGALVIAEEQGWQTRDHSREMWSKLAAELGVEIDPTEEIPAPEPPPYSSQGQPLGERAASHGIAWDGSGETGQPRSWRELSATEQQELVASIMERIGLKVDLDEVAEALTVMEQARRGVENLPVNLERTLPWQRHRDDE